MTLKNFFKIILLSFYSPDLYLEVAKKWQHWGLGFLLRFSILISLVTSLCLFIFISMIDLKGEVFTSLLKQIPEIRIDQNKAIFIDDSLKSPIYLGPNQNMMVIDLDAKTSEKYPQNILAFTAYGITVNPVGSSPFNLSYNDFLAEQNTQIINSESLLVFMLNAKEKLLVMIAILGVSLGSLIYFVITLLKTVFYSSLASICAGIFKLNLTFKQLTRIAIIANAPAFIISSIFFLFFFNSSLENISELIATTVYLLYFMGGVMTIYAKNRN